MRNILIEVYMDFINNYLTIDLWAEHNSLTLEQGRQVIAVARQVYNSEHPES